MTLAIRTSITSSLSRFLDIMSTSCSSVIRKPPLFRRYSVTACLSSFAKSALSRSSESPARTLLPMILTPGVSVRSRFFLAKMALSRTALARFRACSFFLSSPAGESSLGSDRSSCLLSVLCAIVTVDNSCQLVTRFIGQIIANLRGLYRKHYES